MAEQAATVGNSALERVRAESLVRYFVLSGQAIDRRIKQEFKANGIRLSASHAAILPAIELAGTRPTELARRTGLSKQALTRHLRELENAGYLSRCTDPEDGRAALLVFTPHGLALLKKIHRSVQAVETELSARLTADVYTATLNAMRQIAFSDC